MLDCAKVSAEIKHYQYIPVIANFINEDGSDNLKETIEANYRKETSAKLIVQSLLISSYFCTFIV